MRVISAPGARVLENGPEKWFFYFFQTICFWKAETKLGMNLLEFLGSDVIWGRERSSKVIKGQTWKITETRHFICFWKPLDSRDKYVGFILALGVTDLLRSLEVIRGHSHNFIYSSHTEELIEAIEDWKIYKSLQRMKTKEVSTGFW